MTALFAGMAQRLDPAVKFVARSGAVSKNMDRWLGDGGMPLIEALGASFTAYGAEDDGGWVEATWIPTPLACNPHGTVQAGAHAVIHDAAMNFAVNASLVGRDRTRATLEMKTETMRAATAGDTYAARAHVTRLARQVAYAEAAVRGDDGQLVSRSTGTFLLHRES
jgi:uncharacterized protein (TIGR00369 family)